MDPPPCDAPEDGIHGGGSVELRSLLSPSSDGPTDPDGDAIRPPVVASAPRPPGSNVAHAKANPADGPAVERVAFALSNEGIANGLQRLQLAALGAFSRTEEAMHGALARAGRAAAPPGGTPAGSDRNAGSPDSPPENDPAAESTKRKKMVLLLMAMLFVALLGAVLQKFSAVEAERGIEEGGREEAFHVHTPADGGDDGGSPGAEVEVRVIDVEGYQPTTMVNVSDYVLPGTEDAPPLSAAKGRPYRPVLNHFQHRDPDGPYAKTWGSFDFEDPDPEWEGRMRPQPDFASHPNRDAPNSDFPEGAWQRDDAYMKAFLAQARLLVNRSIEAVYAEYGVGIPPDGSVVLTDEQMVNREKFAPLLVKETAGQGGGGSWTTKRSMDDTARRFIHHITTGDTFRLVLGGHSAAAGHGAGFNQSYIIEAGHVLEPVFAHLGVEMRAYNFAQGGMGTFQQSLAGMDLRGKETDWIMWDSSMTEKVSTLSNFFLRQALISGNRSPVLMGDGVNLVQFHDVAGASIAAQGNGWVPVTVDEQQVKGVPWAAQYLSCARGSNALCKSHEYTAGCWVGREDFKPQVPQAAVVGGAASWHPGNRIHKRRGRMVALIVLRTLAHALDKWEELAVGSGYPIAEEHWHVNDYYRGIREKAAKVPGCFGDNWRIGQKRRLSGGEADPPGGGDPGRGGRGLGDGGFWPSRLCDLPLQGRTLWGPRDNPMETSLLSIMRPNPMGDVDPNVGKGAYLSGPCYDPPDRPAPWTVPPPTEPFAPLIGGSRRLAADDDGERRRRRLRSGADGSPAPGKAKGIAPAAEGYDEAPSFRNGKSATRDLAEGNATAVDKDAIVPGYGLNVKWGRPGVCDGSSHSWCDKSCESGCLMGGAQDNRGMVCFDGLSGWLVLDVKDVKHGFIGARMEPWRGSVETPITAGWTKVNNGGQGNYGKRGRERELHEERLRRTTTEGMERMEEEIEGDIRASGGDDPARRLGGGQSCGLVAGYTFEWAINGKVTSWSKDDFCNHFTRLNYNLDVIKFMDDESRSGDFELAMRMTNVGRDTVMCLTHLYWA